MILKLIEPPIRKVALNEELIMKYAESLRKNVRRVHELEFVV